MAITQAFTNQCKLDLFAGVHLAADVYKLALYTSAATLSKATTVYSATNEVVGTAYVAGGVTLTGYASALSGDVAYVSWTDPTWAASTITARGALIYNSTRANAAMAVLDFGVDTTSTNGTFTVNLPPAGATATLQIT